MSPETMLADTIKPTLAYLTKRTGEYALAGARPEVMLLAIGLQESGFEHRFQRSGPARGFWQFERGGGVAGVMQHTATRAWAEAACFDQEIPFDGDEVFKAIPYNDRLACVFARLLLWTDPATLPAPNPRSDLHMGAAWEIYRRTWRPGKPHHERWPANWKRAIDARAAVVGRLD